MKKVVTMRDIANTLNISIVTVSNALGDKEGVSDPLREHIKKTAREMGYLGKVSRSSTPKHTYNIGVIVSDRYISINNSFYWDMYQSLVQHSSTLGHSILLEIITKENEKMKLLPNIITNQKVDGLIVLGQLKEYYLDSLIDCHLPITFLDFYDRHSEIDSIVADNVYGAYRLTNYLIANGHRHIGYVGNIHATSSILDRYLGYYKALIENQLPIHPEWLLSDRDEDGLFHDFKLPTQLPTAFVCNCDETAYHFIRILEKNGLKVPESISVVGFDNYVYATLSTPTITTIDVPVVHMAKEACTAIIRKIEDMDYRLGIKVLSGNLIIRDSVQKTTNL